MFVASEVARTNCVKIECALEFDAGHFTPNGVSDACRLLPQTSNSYGVVYTTTCITRANPIVLEPLVVLAILNYAALLTQRLSRTAGPATVANQVDVNFIVALLWNHLAHQAVCFFVRALLRNDTQPSSDSEDVSIYGKDRAIAGEQQSARDSLWADTFEACEKLLCFLERRVS
jgi:hypothetical protein